MQRFMGRNDIQALLEAVNELSKRLESLEAIDRNIQAQAIIPAINFLVENKVTKNELTAAKNELSQQVNFLQENKPNRLELANIENNHIQQINFLAENKAARSELVAATDGLSITINALENLKAKKTNAIMTTDATDLASCIALVNELKAQQNLMNS